MSLLVDNGGHKRFCVFDFNTGVDHKLLKADPDCGTPVYRLNGLLKAVLGSAFHSHTRIALYPYNSQPTSKQRAAIKAKLAEYVRAHKPDRVYIFRTIDKARRHRDDTSGAHGTNSWDAFNPPSNMQDCMWARYSWGPTEIVAMPACITHTDERVKYTMRHVANMGETEKPKFAIWNVEPTMLEALKLMRLGSFVAVDIETIPSKGILTAIGFSDGINTVSLPWDGWQPSNPSLSYEPSLGSYGQLGDDIYEAALTLLADARIVKVGHNFLYDLKHLRALGLAINGPTWDTLAAHADNHPTLRHALQLAVSSELPCPPWKSEFSAPFDDRDEQKWYYEPQALRRYNCLDAFYTARLYSVQRPRF